MAVISPERIYSVAEYLEREAHSELKYEFVNGKLWEMPGGTGNHNIITANVIAALKVALRKIEKKYIVMGSDMNIQIEAFNHFRYPDAVVVCEKLEYYGDRKDVIINPLLIVEVLSDGTAVLDRGIKFDEYKTLPSFKEYMLISQEIPYVSTYFREEKDLWRTREITGMDATVQLRSVGCELSLAELFEHVEFPGKTSR